MTNSKSASKKFKDDIEYLADDHKGYFVDTRDSVGELLSWVKKFTKRFNLGNISRRFWGDRKTKQVQNIIYKNIDKQADGKATSKKTKFQLFDDLKKDVKSKSHKQSDFARVARTETAALRAIYQLKSWEEAGVIEVTHHNNKGSVARKTVGSRDQKFNGRVFKIKYLLSKSGEKDRIPLHPNCMCYYTPKI